MAARIVAVHVKDIAQPGRASTRTAGRDVGYGIVDWKGLIAALKPKTPAKYFIMEQDNPNDFGRFASALARNGQGILGTGYMAKTLGIGVIGCGNISKAYFSLAPLFRGITMRACADINPDAAKARAKEFGLRAETVDGLLAAEDIDIIVNLTIPAAHYGVSKQILDAGKHVYSEKPFVLSVKEGLDLKKRAEKKGLRIGSAPDTFLGGSHQFVRNLIDTGKLGKITSGTCHVLSHGMEHWHPNPDFFFVPGGGPILDLGPYYIANLIQLIGPVKRVAALASIPQKERTIANGPRNGEKIPVSTPTTIHALMEFAERRGDHLQRELGRLAARPRADGALRRSGHRACAGSELLRRHRSATRRAPSRWPRRRHGIIPSPSRTTAIRED